MIDIDFLKSLNRMRILLKKKIYADRQGKNESLYQGEGLIFKDYKDYVPGDDFRHIDWKIYGRTDKLFIKRFEEEHNFVVHILVDGSASMNFGTGKHKKFEYAAMIGLGFAYLAYKNNEKFNLNIFTDNVSEYRPGKGTHHLIKMLDFMNSCKVQGVTNFKNAMEIYKKRIGSRSLIVVISDFLMEPEHLREMVDMYARKSEVFIIQVLDAEERNLDLVGDVILEDSETKNKLRTFVSHRLKTNYTEMLETHIKKLKSICEKAGARFLSVTTDTPSFQVFYHIFRTSSGRI